MRFFYIIILMLVVVLGNAQNSATISINKIRSTVFSDGQLFHLNDSITGFEEAPVGSGKSINYQGRLWIAGYNEANQYISGAITYRNGPLDTITGLPDTTINAFDHVWKINQSMILDFQQNYQNGPQYIHPDILSWPGNGTGNFAHKLAPFIDLNNNGIYEPLFGDYPELTGDEMLYWIFNDYGSDSMYCQPLNVEIHGMAYAYVCDDINPNSNDEAINNTVFYKYKFYKRGLDTITDFYVGWWQNPNLGNGSDDYIGCDTMRNAAFIYNGDNNDSLGYGLNPPMQSYVQLDGPLAPVNDGLDNDHDSIIDEPNEKILFSGFKAHEDNSGYVGYPDNCQQLRYYLWIRGKDYEPLMNDGRNGYTNGPITHYLFSGIPYSGEPWIEETADNVPGYRLFLMTCGKTNLYPNQPKSYEHAIVFSHYSTAPNGLNTSFALNNAYVDKIQEWYDNQNYPSCYDPTPVKENTVEPGKLVVYPNPTANTATIMLGNGSQLDFYVTDMAGKTVLRGKGNTINLEGLANGMYLLYVDNQKSIFYSKLIKE